MLHNKRSKKNRLSIQTTDNMEVWSQILVSSLIAYGVVYFVKSFIRWRKLPPGPWGLPFIGYGIFIPYEFENHLKQLFAKYGKIFSLTIYGQDVVMISDLEMIKKCMLKDVFNYRPHDWMFTLLDKPHLISWNGEEWKEQRKFSLKIFKQLGVGKTVVEEKIHEEIDYLFGQIEKQQKQLDTEKAGVLMNPLIGPSASNVISLLVTGKRFDFDHPTRKILDDTFLQQDVEKMGSTLGILNYLVPLVRLMLLIPSTQTKEAVDNFEYVKKYIRTQMEYYRKTFNSQSDEALNFIQAYQEEMNSGNVSGKYFDDEHLYANSMAFFAAGSATTKDFIEWCLQVLVVIPEIQEKMRQEIDSVVGRDRRVMMQDKPMLPYCEAVLAEVDRFTSIVPLGLIHAVGGETQLGPYFLSKGTNVIINTFAIHSDPKLFPEPEKFKPERFLSPDGKKFIRDDNLISFGYGKRACPGEPLARTEVFLYVTSFVQKYIITAPPGVKLSLEAKIDSLSRIPKDALQCLFQQRD